MSQLRIPVDEAAEVALAGVAIASDRGYRLAESRGIAAPHFHLPACRRLFEVCARLGDLSGVDEESLAERIRLASRWTQVDLDRVRSYVEDRPVQWDRSGALAARVRRAADARATMSVCQTVFRRLGEGERLDRVIAELGPDVRELLGRSA